MTPLVKTLARAFVIAGAVAISGVAATAAELQCYPQAFSANSPAGTNFKTEDEAHAAAITAWEAGITAQLGHIFADWDFASERTKNCTQTSDGYGGYYYQCEITGYPCYEVPAYTPPKTGGGYTPPKSSY